MCTRHVPILAGAARTESAGHAMPGGDDLLEREQVALAVLEVNDTDLFRHHDRRRSGPGGRNGSGPRRRGGSISEDDLRDVRARVVFETAAHEEVEHVQIGSPPAAGYPCAVAQKESVGAGGGAEE